MAVEFGPLGASQILAVSASSVRATIGTVPTLNPAIAITGLNALTEALYVVLGNSSVTSSLTTGKRIAIGTPDNPTIIPITAGETHAAFVCEGAPGDIVITPGQTTGDSFSPVGQSSILALTNADQRFALPTLGTSAPAIALVAMQGLMDPIWIKLGDNTVTGSVTTSMRVMPGSIEDPAIIRVTNSETHISIFCEGAPGDLILSPGNVSHNIVSPIDATTLDGFDTTSSGNRWGVIAPVAADGVMEIGRYIDFHNSDGDTSDYAVRLETNGGTAGLFETPSGGSLKRIVSLINSTLAQGDIIYYDGTNFVRLAAGTSGQFLKTNGAGANPAWATNGGITTIASGSFPAAATLSLTSIPATYAYLILTASGVSSNTASRYPLVQVSTNNGSSYDSGLNYVDPGGLLTAASMMSFVTARAASATWLWTIYIYAYQGGVNATWAFHGIDSVLGTRAYVPFATYVGSTSAINALQISWAGGAANFDAGTYALYGVS